MRLPKGNGKNFEDNTGKTYWPTDEAAVNAYRLNTSVELAQIRYRRKKEEGTRDYWEKRGLRK